MAGEKRAVGDVEKCLLTEKFHGLCGELAAWRMNPMINLMEKKRDKGRVLGFVKGLRFSARIAYLVRDIVQGILPAKSAYVSWGHLVNEMGTSCSPECDIIVHKPVWLQKWNHGGKHPIMDFKFIKCSDAIAVISCKSLTDKIDKDYCNALRPYKIGKVFLFSECCSPVSVERLRQQAQAAGYAGFYYLYSMKKGGDTFAVNEEGILAFIEEMGTLLDAIPS